MDNEVIAKHNKIFNLMLILLSIFGTLILCEITIRLFDKIEIYAGYKNAYLHRIVSGTAYQRDSHMWGPPLGYSPKPNQILSAKITYDNGDIIFDRKYSIDQYGNRLTINRFPNEQRETIIFYGCSMTFGEGLRDEDTLPSQLAKDLHYKSHIVNMAYNGYGVHQMLRSLELDLPKKCIVGRVRCVIYGAITTAASRALDPTLCFLGFMPGPKYMLDKVDVKYVGEYSKKGIFNYFMYRLKPSLSARSRLFEMIGRACEVNSSDNIAFYIAMLQRARNLIKERYGAEFIIFFYDEPGDLSKKLEKQLIKNNFRYIKRSSIIPLKNIHGSKYAIPGDGHPTADANKEYANYLSKEIVN